MSLVSYPCCKTLPLSPLIQVWLSFPSITNVMTLFSLPGAPSAPREGACAQASRGPKDGAWALSLSGGQPLPPGDPASPVSSAAISPSPVSGVQHRAHRREQQPEAWGAVVNMRGWRLISAWAEWALLQLHKHLLSLFCVPHLHSAGQRRTSSSALPRRSSRICRAQWGLLLAILTQDGPWGLDRAPGPIAPRPVTCRLSCYASTEPSHCAALGARLDPCPQESGGVQPGGASGLVTGPRSVQTLA